MGSVFSSAIVVQQPAYYSEKNTPSLIEACDSDNGGISVITDALQH